MPTIAVKPIFMTTANLSTLAICILLVTPTYSQTKSRKVDVQWGPEFKTSKNSFQESAVLLDETGLYNLVLETQMMGLSSTRYMQKFSPDLALEKTVPQNFTTMGSYAELEEMISLKEKIYVFTSRKSKSEGKYSLFVDELDKSTLKPKGMPETLAQVDYKQGILGARTGSFQYRTSNDDSKLLVYIDQPYEPGEAEKFGFRVYDQEMRPVWSQDVALPYTDDNFSVTRVRLGNNGKAYVLGRVYKDGTGGIFKNMDYRISILEYDGKSDEPKEYKIDLEGKNINEIQMTVADNGDLMCAGFYSEFGSTSSSIGGSFYIRTEGATGEVKSMRTKKFTSEFMKKGMRERAGKRLDKKMARGKNIEMNQYDLREIVRRDDGGVILVAERYYVVVTTTTDANGNTSRTYTYHYEDIIVVNIDPNGEIEWSQKIPKNQITKNDNGFYSSYALKVMGDKLFFIFYDNPKNLAYQSGEPASFRGKINRSLLMLVEVDKVGNVEREPLLGEGDSELFMRPKLMRVMSSNEMLMYARRKKKNQLAKVVFK
ncbi:MAG: hypothetical protein Salg2KO_02840 [Salibacteraceae bacterium]